MLVRPGTLKPGPIFGTGTWFDFHEKLDLEPGSQFLLSLELQLSKFFEKKKELKLGVN
jgi:hypothetical protein